MKACYESQTTSSMLVACLCSEPKLFFFIPCFVLLLGKDLHNNGTISWIQCNYSMPKTTNRFFFCDFSHSHWQGLHHEGIFRVPGSQLEVNRLRDLFEKGMCVFTPSDCYGPFVMQVGLTFCVLVCRRWPAGWGHLWLGLSGWGAEALFQRNGKPSLS